MLLLKTLDSTQRALISQFSSRRDPDNALLYINGYAIANLLATSNFAQIALKEYGINNGHLTMVSEVEYHTPVFIVEDDKKYVLRIFGDDYNIDQLNSEVLWLQTLAESYNLRVPSTLTSLKGSTIIEARADAQSPSRFCALYSWVPGERMDHISDASRRQEIVYRWGEFLGQMHTASANFSPPKWFNRPSYLSSDFERDFTSHLKSEITANQKFQAEDLGRSFLNILSRYDSEGEFGIVHSDLNAGNIIVDRDNSIGMIDFMECMIGYFPINLAQAMDRVVSPEEQKTLLSGYQSVRKISDNFLSDIETIRAVRQFPRSDIAGDY